MNEWHNPVDNQPGPRLSREAIRAAQEPLTSQTGSDDMSRKNTHPKCSDSLNVCGRELTYGMRSSTGFFPSAGAGSPSCIGLRSMWLAAPPSFW